MSTRYTDVHLFLCICLSECVTINLQSVSYDQYRERGPFSKTYSKYAHIGYTHKHMHLHMITLFPLSFFLKTHTYKYTQKQTHAYWHPHPHLSLSPKHANTSPTHTHTHLHTIVTIWLNQQHRFTLTSGASKPYRSFWSSLGTHWDRRKETGGRITPQAASKIQFVIWALRVLDFHAFFNPRVLRLFRVFPYLELMPIC